MASAQLKLRWWLKLICVLLFIVGVVVPCVLLSFAGNSFDYSQVAHHQKSFTLRSHERKPLDYPESRESADTLKFQINELENIRVSVRNELRVMDRERQRLSGEVDSGREILARVKKEIEKVKADLVNTKAKLSRAIRQVERASDGPPPNNARGPLIVVNLPNNKDDMVNDKYESQKDSAKQSRLCRRETCLDFSKCPLYKPFLVYVYNEHSEFSSLFPLRERHVVDSLLLRLKETNTLTSDPKLACLSLLFTGPLSRQIPSNTLEERLISLPGWSEVSGTNHLLVELPYAGSDSHLRNVNCGKAFVAHGVASDDHSFILPPVTIGDDEVVWQGLPLHLPARRQYLLYFEGQHLEGNSPSLMPSDLQLIANAITDKTADQIYIKTSCPVDFAGSEQVFPGEWKLCCSFEQRQSLLVSSTFSLVLGNGQGLSGAHTYTRLVEALRFGAVPVIVGVARLPLDTVIDWSLASVVVPASQFGEIHFLVQSLTDETILAFRRQGRFLWETYFSSPGRMVDSVIAEVRSLFHHPPPAALGETKVSYLVTILGANRQVASPQFQHNFTIYSSTLWNSPPGPFFMYPSTPFQPAPVSGSQYVGLDELQLHKLPRHVVEAGGITGPDFEDYLLGNSPEEQFTVVMLTYERNTVLLEALDRLSDLDSLSKVIVVWNNPSPPPGEMQWPDIGVPLEIVSVGKNSLNNRFLPFPSIETDAILSIDDDVHLRHDEIQFAFRVWREARDRVVGFPGRFHAYDVRHPGKWLYNSNYTCELSMVLTGAAFLHKYYLYLYSQWMPKEVRDIVDNFMNCEDIAMNFLVSHISRKPPIKVTSRWTFRCPGCPATLSTSMEHFNERHICINKFTEIFGYTPLLYTQFRVDSVLFKTRLPSHLEKCYQFV